MNKPLMLILVLVMTIFLGFGIMIPVLPDAIATSGAPEFHLGMLLSIYSLMSFLMSPFWGALSDRIGRKPVMLLGTIGFSISFFVFGMAGEHLELMYVARILGGLFSGAVTTCAVAYVADVTTEDKRTQAMGLVGMSIGLGFIFGPAVGGLLGTIAVSLPFFVAAGLAFLMFVWTWIVIAESYPAHKRAQSKTDTSSRWSAFRGRMVHLYGLVFLVTFTLAGIEATLLLFERSQIGATPKDLGIMFAVSGLAGALIQGGVVRKWIKKGQELSVVIIGLVISAIGFALIPFSDSLVTATLYLSIFAIGNALIRPCVTSLITIHTPVQQGVSSGLSSSMDSLGRILGPLAATGLYAINHSLPFMVGALLTLAGIWFPLMFIRAQKWSQVE